MHLEDELLTVMRRKTKPWVMTCSNASSKENEWRMGAHAGREGTPALCHPHQLLQRW